MEPRSLSGLDRCGRFAADEFQVRQAPSDLRSSFCGDHRALVAGAGHGLQPHLLQASGVLAVQRDGVD